MAFLKFRLRGDRRLRRNLTRLGPLGLKAVGKGLFQEGEAIMSVAKTEQVPVDMGPLRASGHVELPRVRFGEVSVELGFGGPSAPYALIQHETPWYRHPVGKWKYLEDPMKARAPDIPKNVAAVVDREIRHLGV